MRWDFHGVCVEGQSNDPAILSRWRATFASRPHSRRPAVLTLRLSRCDRLPSAPAGQPDFSQGELLQYFVEGERVTAHFPRFGQIRLDLRRGLSEGELLESALQAPGAFEDLVAIGLSPHFRRRGLFLLHAFAAAQPSPSSREDGAQASEAVAVLLVGQIGAGKTTTGLALLHAGWKLLSNDSPILTDEPTPRVCAYPGLLSAYPDSLTRFAELPQPRPATADSRQKVLFAAESVYPDVWINSARPGAILFPRVERRAEHTLERLSASEALRHILPHAVEQWDREMIPAHLALLNRLVQAAPAYRLRLGPDVEALPDLIASASY